LRIAASLAASWTEVEAMVGDGALEVELITDGRVRPHILPTILLAVNAFTREPQS
jgi:hypothetical protein